MLFFPIRFNVISFRMTFWQVAGVCILSTQGAVVIVVRLCGAKETLIHLILLSLLLVLSRVRIAESKRCILVFMLLGI